MDSAYPGGESKYCDYSIQLVLLSVVLPCKGPLLMESGSASQGDIYFMVKMATQKTYVQTSVVPSAFGRAIWFETEARVEWIDSTIVVKVVGRPK